MITRNIAFLILIISMPIFSAPDTTITDTLAPVETETTYSETESLATESNLQTYFSKRFILSFAEELFKRQEYERAFLEYMRYRYYYPSDTIVPYVEFRMGLCDERIGKYKSARELYEGLIRQLEPNHQLRDDAYYRYLLTFLLENNYSELYTRLDITRKQNSSVLPDDVLDYLEGVALFEEGEFSRAESVLAMASKGGSFVEPSINYLLSKVKQTRFLPQRNPYFAGALSMFIPGAGQAYTGRWGDAFYSFASAVGGIGSGIYFWKKDKTFAIISLSLGTFFYLGNIYGATVSAILFNKNSTSEFISKTEKELPHKPAEIFLGH